MRNMASDLKVEVADLGARMWNVEEGGGDAPPATVATDEAAQPN